MDLMKINLPKIRLRMAKYINGVLYTKALPKIVFLKKK